MIGESLGTAKKRYLQLENRLSRDVALYENYCSAVKQYLELRYLVEVSPDMSQGGNVKPCYLPHHPVIKLFSASTKVRPVFDGSAKTSTGFALNDCLLNGPVLQDTLFDLIVRFRSYAIALIASIRCTCR